MGGHYVGFGESKVGLFVDQDNLDFQYWIYAPGGELPGLLTRKNFTATLRLGGAINPRLTIGGLGWLAPISGPPDIVDWKPGEQVRPPVVRLFFTGSRGIEGSAQLTASRWLGAD